MTSRHEDPPAAPAAPRQRHEWHSRFGLLVIEVVAGRALVNGKPVEPVEQTLEHLADDGGVRE